MIVHSTYNGGIYGKSRLNRGEEKTMRWINAEKVIHTQIYDDEHEEWSEREMTIEEFLDAFTDEGCPTVVTQPEPQWIPCSERLPEANGRYLVTRGLNACGDLWNRVYIINYSDLMGLKSERIWWDGNVGKSDFERIDDVIAWMPLQEPYKGES